MTLSPGTRLGPYEITASLGAGGMGEVYRARDSRLQRQVAIKTLASHAAGDPQFRERFEREARAIAALSHPNILAIYDVGSHEGMPYVAIELLEGETLRSRIGTTPLPISTVLENAVQIGRGLTAAHDRGIVHRDLKPDNIFVTRDGQVKLLDFGLATEPSSAPEDYATRLPQTGHGMLLGTVGYMSPEQARGDRSDTRSDIFSFGCVLYEMVSARRAFTGDSRVETLHAILKEHPPDLASLRRDVSPGLDRVIRRCLEKSPESRFQTARDLVFALESLVAAPVSAIAAPPPSRLARRLAPALLVAAAVGVAAVAWWAVARDPKPQDAAPPAASPAVARRLIAVLPFENISRGEGYFAAGMTEEISNRLSKLSGLGIVSRTAVAGFKDPHAELPRMVQELGISNVVAGTVREDGSRVRVNVELIDAGSRQVTWSEQYDREGVDVFTAQSEIALKVADVLEASVTLDERTRIGKRPTSSLAAYELYVRARNLRGLSSAVVRLQASIDLLRQAVAVDPQFAEAYSEIADRYYFLAAYGDLSALPKGLDAAHKALAIDPQLSSAHHGLAMNLQQQGRLQDALAAHRRAVELDPNSTGNLVDFGFGLVTAGRCDEALESATRAQKLTPNTSAAPYHVGVALLCLDDDARTERYLTTAATRFPTASRLPILLAFLDLRRGQPQAASDRIRAVVEKAPNNIEALLARAEILTFAEAPDAAEVVRSLHDRAADGMFHNAPYPVKLAHAYHLQRSGAKAAAAKILDEMTVANRASILAGADWPMVFIQNAAVHAMRGESNAAFDELQRAYDAGWRDGRTLAIDPLFTSIRDDPRFGQLLSRIQADVAAMRARADYSALP